MKIDCCVYTEKLFSTFLVYVISYCDIISVISSNVSRPSKKTELFGEEE